MTRRKLERPYVVCHMLSSVDGRIDGGFYAEAGNAVHEYGALRATFRCEATLYGTTTALEFAHGEAGALPAPGQLLPYTDYVAPSRLPDYLVAIDARGRIGWTGGTFERPGRPKSHIIEALTEQAAPEYPEYLRARGISYVFCGEARIDFALLLHKLKELFGIERILLAGGGLINGAMLDAGLIDELSVVVAPAVDGGKGATLFDGTSSAAGLSLTECRQLDGGGIWLRYSVLSHR